MTEKPKSMAVSTVLEDGSCCAQQSRQFHGGTGHVQIHVPDICSDSQLGPWWRFWKRRRYLLTVLAFFGFFCLYCLRVNLSIAIVSMTAPRPITIFNGTVVYVRDFEWDSKTQGVILSSFFYGYILTQIPGGWLASKIGGHRLFGIGVGATAFLTLFTPPFAYADVNLLIALRIMEGILEGVTHPCISTLWSRWSPPLERSRLAATALSGSFVGTVISMPLSGIIAEYLHWPSIFYIFGTAGLVWFVFWWMIVKESPELDPYISPEELRYIQESLGPQDKMYKVVNHPWKKILSSPPVWAGSISHFVENWGYYTFLTQLPTYMNDVFKYDIQKAGFLSAVPYLFLSIGMQFSGHAADLLQNGKYMSATMIRKIYISGVFFLQLIFMIMVAFLTSSSALIFCITIAVALSAFSWSGISVNHLDLAPQHAGILMGLSQTVATVPGIISPLITGYIVQEKSAGKWQSVFFITSSVYLCGGIIYILFGSADRQSWAEESHIIQKQNDVNRKTNHH